MKSGLMNKAFLITGASGGIGRATAQAFAEEGARLALHYHTNRESVEELSHSIDVDTVLVGGNVAKEEDVETMYRDALSSLKRLDGSSSMPASGSRKKHPCIACRLNSGTRRWQRT